MEKRAALPAFVDMPTMAKRRRTLRGSYACVRLSRLASALHGSLQDVADIDFELCFFIDERNKPTVQGWVQATLPLLCQRCLQPMSFALKRNISLCHVQGHNEIQDLSAGTEPLEAAGPSGIRVQDLIEDELLLSLPYAPRHEAGCLPPRTGAGSDRG